MPVIKRDVAVRLWRRCRPSAWPLWLAVLATLLILGGSAIAVWVAISLLLVEQLPWNHAGGPVPQQIDVLKLGLTVIAGGGGAVALVVAYRRQRILEQDDTRLLTERYGAAAGQLGDSEAAVRLAGVYALSAVADEWRAQRQQCIDVLCGYLRLPYAGDPPMGHPSTVVHDHTREFAGSTHRVLRTTSYRQGEVEVRNAIIDTIARHVKPSASPSWSDLDFDLHQARLHDVDLQKSVFSGTVNLRGAVFSGEYTLFKEARFSGKLTSFVEANFNADSTDFALTEFSGSNTLFTEASFTGHRTTFQLARFTADVTSFADAKFRGDYTEFSEVDFTGNDTYFWSTDFTGDDLTFSQSDFKEPFTIFKGANFVRSKDGVDRSNSVRTSAFFPDDGDTGSD